jgi:Kelch motif/Galactose oxidase, central domain
LKVDNQARDWSRCADVAGLNRTRTRILQPSLPFQIVGLKRNERSPFTKSLVQLTAAINQSAMASCLARPVMLLLLSFSAGLASIQPGTATPFEWEYTGNLKTARFHHTATLLPDGRVLVAGGGDQSGSLRSAELYDPASGTWSAAHSLKTARDSQTATLLANGKVLVAGGFDGSAYLATAELYDPATGAWSYTGSLNDARAYQTETLLPNGKVLVAGGRITTRVYLATAELYDPATGIWSLTGSFKTPRIFHTATLLPNGKVLVAGGRAVGFVPLASAQLYDPTTGIWSDTGSLNNARYDHTATLLPNGKVLVAGGNPDEITSAELYDPATGTWSITGDLNDGRGDHVANLLTNGMALVAGGTSFDLATTELYDPATGTWSRTGSLNNARKDHAGTLLPNGMVLVTGGAFAGGVALASAELYDPGIVVFTKVKGDGTISRQGNRVTFHLRASLSDDSTRADSFSFCDPAADACLTNAGVRNLSIDGNTAAFNGTARLDNGTKVQYDVSVTDNGRPGTSDTISIELNDGYSASGTLTTGDIRIY